MTAYPCGHGPFQRGFNSYGVTGYQFGRTNGDRQFNSHPRQGPNGEIHGGGSGRPSYHARGDKGGWHERFVYRRTEQPHCQVRNVTSETAPQKLRAPEQRGMKRDWCEAESSDSPQQDNNKMRPETEDQSLRQDQHGGSGAFLHEPPIVMQGVMERDGCEAGASDSPHHDDNSKVRLEDADQPHCQVQAGSSGAALDELPVPEEGGVEINLCEAETSDTPGQLKHQAQHGSSGAVSLDLPATEQQRMETDSCDAEPSDVPSQAQDGSSEAASHGLPVPEQRGMGADSCDAEPSTIHLDNIEIIPESVEPDS
uniref:Uncharacterized protein n=1 Tax=Arundo donax TaxID=35708 RepID=A0A0A9AQN9_ARUDO